MRRTFLKKGKGKGYASQSAKEHKAHHKIQRDGTKLAYKTGAYSRSTDSGNNFKQNSCKFKLRLKGTDKKASYKNKTEVSANNGNRLIYGIAFNTSAKNIGVALMAHTAKGVNEYNRDRCCFNTARG